jgi:hypothetical protein
MCLIIDANTVSSVFNPKAQEHSRFIPVLNWITAGRGCIIYGGTKYKQELKKTGYEYLRMIGNLSRQGRVVILPTRPIDSYAAVLKIRVPAKEFDDEHIVAIVAYSGCRVVCTNDKASHPYLQRQDLYPKGVKRPKIYSAASHFRLCCDDHLIVICRGRH